VHIEGASTLRPTQYSREANLRARIAKHVLEVLHVQLNEVIMEHSVLCEQLVMTQKKVEILEEVAFRQ
jgi:hypothetical protein